MIFTTFQDDGTSMDLIADEYKLALGNVRAGSNDLDCDATIIHERSEKVLTTSNSGSFSPSNADSTARSQSIAGQDYSFAHLLIRKRQTKVEDLSEVRICVTGNVDAGKSTLLGVLTKNALDDGRGKARVNLFRFKHELESGRTSSVGTEVMGFDSKGEIVAAAPGKPKLDPEEVIVQSVKVVTFLDLAGHEKYLKTTVFGMTGCCPDFVML